MDLRYNHDDQPVAEGERSVLYKNGKLYIRTGFLGEDLTDPKILTMKYRLREVYDKAAVIVQPPVNHLPVARDTSSTIDLGATP